MARIFVNFARAIQFSGCFTRTRASVSVRFESVPKKKKKQVAANIHMYTSEK